MPRIRPQFHRNRHPLKYSNFLNGIRNSSTTGILEMGSSGLEWERVFTCRKRTIMKKALELNNLTNSVVSVYIKSPSGEVWFYASDDGTKQSLQKCGLIDKNSMRVTSDSLQNKMITGDKINECDTEEKSDVDPNLSNTHSEKNRINSVNGNSSHQKDDNTSNSNTFIGRQNDTNKQRDLPHNKASRNITSTPLYKPRNANSHHSNRLQQISTPNVSLIPPPTYESATHETQTFTTILSPRPKDKIQALYKKNANSHHSNRLQHISTPNVPLIPPPTLERATHETQTFTTILSPKESPMKITEELDEDVIAISNIQEAIDLTSSPDSQSSINSNEDTSLGDNVDGETIEESILPTKTHPKSTHNDSASCRGDDKFENQISDVSVKLENPYANEKNWNFVSEASDSDSSDDDITVPQPITPTENNVKNREDDSTKVQKSSPKRANIHCENNSNSTKHNNPSRSKSSLHKPETRHQTTSSHRRRERTDHRRDENRYKFQRSNQNGSRPREPRTWPDIRSEQSLHQNRRHRDVIHGLNENNGHRYAPNSTSHRRFQYHHQDQYTLRRHHYPTYSRHHRYNKDTNYH